MGRYVKNGTGRTRNYATVIYDDSCIDKINDLHIPCFISPWHDNDINATGEKKKPHRHVLFNFDSVKSIEQVRDVVEQIGGVGCEQVDSNRAYARYLCHLDNPDKAQYNINDVLTIGGLDYIDLINSVASVYATLDEIIDYLLKNNVTSLRDFILYCQDIPDWWTCIFRHRHLSDVKEIIKANQFDMITKNK